MIFTAGVAIGTTGALVPAGALAVELAPPAVAAAEPAAAGAPDPVGGGAGAAAAPEADAPVVGSAGFCVAGWLAAEAAGAGAGGIGPVSCAAKGSAHSATRNNRRACAMQSELFVIGPLFTIIR